MADISYEEAFKDAEGTLEAVRSRALQIHALADHYLASDFDIYERYLKSARVLFDFAFNIDPKGTAKYTQRADISMQFGDWERAEEALEDSYYYETDPIQRSTILRMRAEISMELGDDASAMTFLEDAVIDDAYNPRAHELLGNLLIREGQLETARIHYHQAIKGFDGKDPATVDDIRAKLRTIDRFDSDKVA